MRRDCLVLIIAGQMMYRPIRYHASRHQMIFSEPNDEVAPFTRSLVRWEGADCMDAGRLIGPHCTRVTIGLLPEREAIQRGVDRPSRRAAAVSHQVATFGPVLRWSKLIDSKLPVDVKPACRRSPVGAKKFRHIGAAMLANDIADVERAIFEDIHMLVPLMLLRNPRLREGDAVIIDMLVIKRGGVQTS